MSLVEASKPGREVQQKANAGRGWYAVVARVGLVARGLSYGLVGVLAVKLAIGDGGTATSQQGALQSLVRRPFGKYLLIGLAVGFAAYALWRFIQAYAERADGADATLKGWGKRLAYLGRGLAYATLTFTALRIVSGSGGNQSQNQQAHQSTAAMLGWPGGRYLVGALGVVLLGLALGNVYEGLARTFEDEWRVNSMGPTVRRWGARAGVVGHVARGVGSALIGVFVIKAAYDYKPSDAIGLDGALQKLAAASYGPWLLGLTAAGLIAYGVFCLVDARLRDVSTNT